MTHHEPHMGGEQRHEQRGGGPSEMGGGMGRETGGEMGQHEQMGGGQMEHGAGGQMAEQPMRMGMEVEDNLTGDMRIALYDAHTAVKACEWCADQCIDHGQRMARCARLCRDVADIGSTVERFMARNSLFMPDIAAMFINVAEECAMECEQFEDAHCQDCAKELWRAVDTMDRVLQTV